jgi:uncharacterized protein
MMSTTTPVPKRPESAPKQSDASLHAADSIGKSIGAWFSHHRRAVAVGAASVILLLVLALGAIGWVGSERGIHPERKVEPHTLAEYAWGWQAEHVRFSSLDGTPLAGWFIPAGEGPAPAVILLHGYGRSRAELLPHADYLHRAGYHVLMMDFRGRGESGGGAVTLGAKEPLDVRGAVSYALTRPEVDPQRIALQGVSLGASSGILAMADEPHVAAIVAESPFTDMSSTIARSFEHYIDLPSFPFAPITQFIVERRLGVDADDVRPIDAIPRIGARPVFVIEDSADQDMPEHSGSRLYAAATGPKEYWLIEGTGHAGGYKAYPEEYARRVIAFYTSCLRGATRGE